MSRLLLLTQDDLRLAIDEQAVERVELLAPDRKVGAVSGREVGAVPGREVEAVPSLLPLLGLASADVDASHEHGRVLTLRNGQRVRVPAAMQLIDNVEVLLVPELLRSAAARVGVIGLVELEGGPTLVCDPRALLGSEEGAP